MTEVACATCGALLPAEAQFCPRCGAPTAAAGTEERRLVTVLFADLAGSTELSAALDPERYREVMTAFYDLATDELSSLRGRAEKFIGDAVMAVFGVPTSHDDDALRAVRAGLRIREGTARLAKTLNLPAPLEVRVGINSGAVAAGPGPAGRPFVSGAPVNLAARIQQAAEPGEVLVGGTTWHLTRDAVAFGRERTVPARGFDHDVHVHPVEGLSPRSSRRTIPIVGRRRELDMLRETFDRVRETSRAHLVTLLGEAGIGKSRLADELIARLPREAAALIGRTGEYDEDPTFAPIAGMLRQELDVAPTAPAEALRERLHEVVSGCCQPTDVERVAAQLGMALGLAAEDPQERRYRMAELRAGFLTFLEGKTRVGPVVLVFEDLHLARAELLDLVPEIALAARRLPVMLLCLARDELLELRPAWGGGIPDAATLRLEPLTAAEAADLARAAAESLDDPAAERIALHAGGNPFFIVEATGMLLHEDRQHDAGLRSPLLPPTVQAVVASRIDHLPEEARRLVRTASVFVGPAFALSKLALVAEPRAETLQMLEEEELLLPDPPSPDRWRFRHEMLREVAYESLPKRERMRLHLTVADGIIAEGDAERHPTMIAYHLEQAALSALDLDPRDRTLPERAVDALANAGDRARWRMESVSAVDLYRRGLALAGPDGGWGTREARILAGLGEARYWLGEFDAAEAELGRALEVGKDDPWAVTLASRFLADIALNVRAEPERAERLFDEALAAARELDSPWAIARTLLMAGWVPIWKGDHDGGRRMFEEALAIARGNPERDRSAEARALTSLASAISPIGDETEALALGQQALALGEELGNPFTIAVASQYVGNSLRRMWRLDEALPHFESAVAGFRDLRARWELASALGDRGMLFRLTGRLDEAEADLRESLAICLRIAERTLVTWTAAELARILIARGELEAAREILADPSSALTPEPASQADLHAARALLALAERDRERALAHGREALAAGTHAEGNGAAGWRYWVGTVFGPDAAGGEEAVVTARKQLEAAHWIGRLREPEVDMASSRPDPRRGDVDPWQTASDGTI